MRVMKLKQEVRMFYPDTVHHEDLINQPLGFNKNKFQEHFSTISLIKERFMDIDEKAKFMGQIFTSVDLNKGPVLKLLVLCNI